MKTVRMADPVIYGSDLRILRLADQPDGITPEAVSKDRSIKNRFERQGTRPSDFTPSKARDELKRLVCLGLMEKVPVFLGVYRDFYRDTSKGQSLLNAFR